MIELEVDDTTVQETEIDRETTEIWEEYCEREEAAFRKTMGGVREGSAFDYFAGDMGNNG